MVVTATPVGGGVPVQRRFVLFARWPNALLLDFSLAATQLADATASFKSPAELKKVLAAAGITPDQDIVTYGNGGLGRSTYLLAALTLDKLR